jgi:hypothetical protein
MCEEISGERMKGKFVIVDNEKNDDGILEASDNGVEVEEPEEEYYKKNYKPKDILCQICSKKFTIGFIGIRWNDCYSNIGICESCLKRIMEMMGEEV